MVTCILITMKNRKKIAFKIRLLSHSEPTTIKIRLLFWSDTRLPSKSDSYSNQKPLCTHTLWWLLFKSKTENAVKRDTTSKSDKAYRCFRLNTTEDLEIYVVCSVIKRDIGKKRDVYLLLKRPVSVSKETCICARKIPRNTDGLLSN